MAVNQVSLFFYPLRWTQRLTPSRGRTDAGTPVQIADAIPVEGATAAPVPVDTVKKWLLEQGFTPVDWRPARIFERGQVRSMFGCEKEIEVSVAEHAGEVVDLYCRFTLPRGNLPPVNAWADFIAALCERFGLRLPNGATPCTATEFRAAVERDRNYQSAIASGGGV
jgi:hypothetical protein